MFLSFILNAETSREESNGKTLYALSIHINCVQLLRGGFALLRYHDIGYFSVRYYGILRKTLRYCGIISPVGDGKLPNN